MIKAQVFRSSSKQFNCQILGSKEIVVASAKGALIKDHGIVVGDLVNLEQLNDQFNIVSIEERSNQIFRIIQREKKRKVIAANVDVIVLTMSISKPKYKEGLVDRYLIRSFQWDIPLLLVFNKMDQYDAKKSPDINFQAERLKALGIKCYELSAKQDCYQNTILANGIAELEEELKNKTAIFLGQSGVGKSKLITKLSDGKFELKSEELAKVGKGAHTTTWSEIIDLDKFKLVDSPGIRSFSLSDLEKDDLDNSFQDLLPYFEKCKFQNCKHDEKAEGCGLNNLDSNLIETKFIISRLHSYSKILEEIEQIPAWKKT